MAEDLIPQDAQRDVFLASLGNDLAELRKPVDLNDIWKHNPSGVIKVPSHENGYRLVFALSADPLEASMDPRNRDITLTVINPDLKGNITLVEGELETRTMVGEGMYAYLDPEEGRRFIDPKNGIKLYPNCRIEFYKNGGTQPREAVGQWEMVEGIMERVK